MPKYKPTFSLHFPQFDSLNFLPFQPFISPIPSVIHHHKCSDEFPFYLKSEGYSENGDKKFILRSCVRWNEKTVCVLIFHQNTNPIFPLTPFLSKAKIMHYSHWSPSNYASSLFDTNHQTYISHLHIWPTHNLGTSGTLFCIASHRLGSGLLTSQRGLCSVTHTI